MTDFIPFTQNHLDAAARLLAKRHITERNDLSRLPSEFESVDYAKKAIQAVFDKENTIGFAAFSSEKMLAYMLGTFIENDYLGDKSQGWIYLPAHVAEDEALYSELYARIADKWVKHGCFHHYVLVAATNQTVQDVWFSLSFGREQAHGAVNCDEVNFQDIDLGNITIRESKSDDKTYFREMSQWISRYQVWTPTFAPVNQDYLNQQTDSFATLSTDKDATTFLAFRDDELIGYQVYYAVETDDSNMMHPRNAAELVVAATKPDLKGQGIGHMLTQHAFREIQKLGYSTCVADWRTANRASSRFWQKVGFVHTHYRLVRRIDERISSIYKELYT